MISIIIPVYNHQDYLADAIDSALGQTVPCEVICVDDGSTDNSVAIADSYKDRIKVIHQTNRGLPSARNTGIMNANGEYILPLDSDDILQDNAIERLEQAIKQTGADVIAPSFKCFGMSQADVILMPNPTINDFRTANRIAYCAAVKKSALLEVGGYSAKMVYGYEDYHLWITLLRLGKRFVTLPDKLMLYRTKEVSMLTEALKHHDELIGQIVKDNREVYA